jgi:hypothetical protein
MKYDLHNHIVSLTQSVFFLLCVHMPWSDKLRGRSYAMVYHKNLFRVNMYIGLKPGSLRSVWELICSSGSCYFESAHL